MTLSTTLASANRARSTSERARRLVDVFVLDHSLLLGVWTNRTEARLGRDEITIDFVRDIRELPRGVLVARVIAPPRVFFHLRDHLDEVLRSYTDRSMPEDVT
ncbi:MAG: hypothetical protein H0T97_03720 [Actinobacteria bacterium]|nr:hypothetical protein [Actinomycetota bacterium]